MTFAIYLGLTDKPPTIVESRNTEVFEITAYTVGDDFTPSHGITASGKRVKARHTIACPSSLPFGTRVYIPELDRTYVCEDRGSRITDRHLDIYMTSRSKAMDFGRRKMKVEIIIRENADN